MTLAKSNPEYIRALLERNNTAVERAIIAIYNRQTQDEQADEATKHHNNMGFSAVDCRLGTYYAKWIIAGNNLSGNHLNKARHMALKYIKQLCEIANQREIAQIKSNDIEREAIQNEGK